MRDSTRVLAHEINMEDTQRIFEHVQSTSKLVDDLVNKLVSTYCGPLDEYMKTIDNALAFQEEPLSILQLEEFTLNLPSLLYFASEAQEALGIKEDVSNAIRTELYNAVREKAQGTIADKDTAAEIATQSEQLVVIIYRRAYKKVKYRIEAAYEMLNSLKKVISRRIGEYSITGSDRGGVSLERR